MIAATIEVSLSAIHNHPEGDMRDLIHKAIGIRDMTLRTTIREIGTIWSMVPIIKRSNSIIPTKSMAIIGDVLK